MNYPKEIHEAERQIQQAEADYESSQARDELIDRGATLQKLGKKLVLTSPENEAEINATIAQINEITSTLIETVDAFLSLIHDAKIILDGLKNDWDEIEELKRRASDFSPGD